MQQAWIVAGLALLATGPAAGSTLVAEPGAGGDLHGLAQAVVERDDGVVRATKSLQTMEAAAASLIAGRLGSGDPADAARVQAMVHDAFSPIIPKVARAATEAYAANFSAAELTAVLAFTNSPAGLAERNNLPRLKEDLTAALRASSAGEAATRVFLAAPPGKQAQVRRILAAQDYEARTRRGLQTLQTSFSALTRDVGSRAEPNASDAALRARQEKAADDYVANTVAVTERFYVERFSEAELAAIADYLESEPGHAMLTRTPAVQRALVPVLGDEVGGAISAVISRYCAANPCSPEQHARLNDLSTELRAYLPKAMTPAS